MTAVISDSKKTKHTVSKYLKDTTIENGQPLTAARNRYMYTLQTDPNVYLTFTKETKLMAVNRSKSFWSLAKTFLKTCVEPLFLSSIMLLV